VLPTIRPRYLLVLDNLITTVYPTRDDAAYVLYLRERPVLYRGVLGSDSYVRYMKDNEEVFGLCRDVQMWVGVDIRGVIDLRADPVRFGVVGGRSVPYMTEWDLLMDMVG
jgi:hypothetical protein